MQDQVDVPLFTARLSLLKAVDSPGGNPKFGGVASSEAEDEDGDTILRKALDISYLQKRGYVNWNHSKEPGDQLGFVTQATIILPSEIPRYEDLLQTPLSKSASLYVQGEFYGKSRKARDVADLLASIPPGEPGGMGMSAEGGMLKSEGGVVRAVVRGVAITPGPAQSDALCRLVKSLSLGVNTSVESVVATEVLEKGLTESQAIVRLMELRPNFSLELAKKVVSYVFNQVKAGG